MAGAAIFLVYVATLAPGVTFWDAGEFIASIESMGIPHPPGTPLFIIVGRAWRLLLAFMPAAMATNLLSALCTAVACAMGGSILSRRTGRPVASAGGALCAGAMSSVWLNATETEVYSVSLLLSALAMYAGMRAAEKGESRWLVLLGFLLALAAPLHASALVAAPAAVSLALAFGEPATTARSFGTRGRLFDLACTFAAAAGTATGHFDVAILGFALLAIRGFRDRDARRLCLVALVGVSPLVIMLIRSRFDPAINQGDPSTLDALLGVIARRQYAVAAPWPRQAPLWLQAGNVLEYVDWQVALGLAPGPTPHVARTSFTLAFLALGAAGARRLRRDDGMTWRAMLLLVASASVGVMLYLNLKAGPSIGWDIVADSTGMDQPPGIASRVISAIVAPLSNQPHEARERDYFFSLAFWGWGLLAGYGAVRVVEEWRGIGDRHGGALDQNANFGSAGGVRRPRGTRISAGLALAALPIALNWRAVDRRREPDASAPRLLAARLLSDAPPSGVLFVWGDNDTYPLWFAQRALGTRRDVLVVTISLLSAPWYRTELARRDSLFVGPWRGELETVRQTASAARARRRPVAFASTVPAPTRLAAGSTWHLCGTVWSERSVNCSPEFEPLDAWLVSHPVSDVTDPMTQVMLQALRCPGLDVRARASPAAADSLDSVCNAR